MIEFQQLIHEIRTLIEGDDQSLTAEFKRVAELYTAYCKNINHRLHKCDDLLRQGLRSEAVQLAEQAPKLLEMVNVAEFLERPEFVKLMSDYGFPRPEAILAPVAEALNEAYWELQPLEKMLDRHRLLAIAHAPLRDRLAILRRLSAADPESKWSEDVREMEAARLREMEVESQRAAQAGDVARLSAIVDDLASLDWKIEVPASLSKGIKQRHGVAVRQQARLELQRLKEELDIAYMALDAPRARLHRKAWEEQSKLAQLKDEDELAAHVAPVLAWLADEDQREKEEKTYESTVRAVEAELDKRGVELETLERLKQQVERAGRGLPDAVGQQLKSKVSALRQTKQREWLLVVGSSAAAALLICLGIGWIFWRQLDAAEMHRTIAAIDQLLDDGDCEAAESKLTESARFSSYQKWLDARQRVKTAIEEEQQRISKFEDAVGRIRTAAAFNATAADFATLEELKKTPKDSLAIDGLKQEWTERQAKMAAEKDAVIQPLLHASETALGRLSKMHPDQLAEPSSTALLGEAEQNLEKAEARLAGASLAMVKQQLELSRQLTQLKGKIREQTERAAILSEMTGNAILVPNDSTWTRKLLAFDAAQQAYVKKFPTDSRSAAFRQQSEVDLARRVLQGQELVRAWLDLLPLDSAQVRLRKSRITDYLKDASSSPDAPDLRDYLEYLSAVLRRDEGLNGGPDGSIRSTILSVFGNPAMQDLQMLQMKNGDTYYVKEKKTFNANQPVAFKYVYDYDVSMLRSAVGIKYPDLKSGFVVDAPHVALAKGIRVRFGGPVPVARWRSDCMSTVKELSQAQGVDGFLRFLLTKRMIEFAGAGDAALAAGLAPVAELLNDQNIDPTTRWMDPTDESVKENRRLATDCVERVTDELLATALDTAKQWEKSLQMRVQQRRQAIGWLTRTPEGDWSLQTTWRVDGLHRLSVIAPLANGASEWVDVGSVNRDGISISQNLASSAVREGKLVFASALPTK